jgi:hypothetical protein
MASIEHGVPRRGSLHSGTRNKKPDQLFAYRVGAARGSALRFSDIFNAPASWLKSARLQY